MQPKAETPDIPIASGNAFIYTDDGKSIRLTPDGNSYYRRGGYYPYVFRFGRQNSTTRHSSVEPSKCYAKHFFRKGIWWPYGGNNLFTSFVDNGVIGIYRPEDDVVITDLTELVQSKIRYKGEDWGYQLCWGYSGTYAPVIDLKTGKRRQLDFPIKLAFSKYRPDYISRPQTTLAEMAAVFDVHIIVPIKGKPYIKI